MINHVFTCIFTIYGHIMKSQRDQLSIGLVAQLVEHCTGNAKVVGLNPVQSLKFFQVIFPVVLWLHSHLSLFN